jgi:alpha-amylase/alpha-mannosidase (GH57 family)
MTEGHRPTKEYPPLAVAFVWHMHQPDYRDLATGEARLPWARLHGLKDYYDMAAVLEQYPAVHQTFNLVPSLVAQLETAARGEFSDPHLRLFERPAGALSPEERVELLRTFFQANLVTIIAPLPRYAELLERRGSAAELAAAAASFTEQDCRDLQVLFHLAWIDPTIRDGDEQLRALVAKGRDYTEADKRRLGERMRAILDAIVPLHRRLAARGQIEVTTSPFYHPILPLLCDTNVAREALPDVRLPACRFAHPEDAAAQLTRAAAFMRERFGQAPAGLWPSEGSVSEAILPLVAQAGFRWLASDEEILARSLGVHFATAGEGARTRTAALYRPYRLRRPGGVDLAIVFRDHVLSDLIGFVYSRWEPVAAADDLIARLHGIATALGEANRDGGHLVSIILDGENAWEHYPADGRDFFARLYGRLSESATLRAVTVGEHLAAHPPEAEVPRLLAGSWINHNFRIWIGHEEDNAAWDALGAARDALVSAEQGSSDGMLPPERLAAAWDALYAAEGSDWTWWYGDDHPSDHELEFDALFRGHVIRLYGLIGRPAPADLTLPIKGRFRVYVPEERPRAFISPTIDGLVTGYYEWYGAGRYEPGRAGSAMHQTQGVVTDFRYGFDLDTLYLRIDTSVSLDTLVEGLDEGAGPLTFALVFAEPEPMEVEVRLEAEGRARAELRRSNTAPRPLPGVAAEEIVELAVPFAELAVLPETELRFRLAVRRGGKTVEEWPDRGFLVLDVPTEDFEAEMWSA